MQVWLAQKIVNGERYRRNGSPFIRHVVIYRDELQFWYIYFRLVL
jgi:hypothetical protein